LAGTCHHLLHFGAYQKTIFAFTERIPIVNFYFSQSREFFFTPVLGNCAKVLFKGFPAEILPDVNKNLLVIVKIARLVQVWKGIVAFFRPALKILPLS
jgi:hypothetical protein